MKQFKSNKLSARHNDKKTRENWQISVKLNCRVEWTKVKWAIEKEWQKKIEHREGQQREYTKIQEIIQTPSVRQLSIQKLWCHLQWHIYTFKCTLINCSKNKFNVVKREDTNEDNQSDTSVKEENGSASKFEKRAYMWGQSVTVVILCLTN